MSSDGVLTAFEIIMEELQEVSEEIKGQTKAVLDEEGFRETESLIATGKLLDAFFEKVDALRDEWLASFDAQIRERTRLTVPDVSDEVSSSDGGHAKQQEPNVELYLKIKNAEARATRAGERKITLLPGSTVCKDELSSLPKTIRENRASCINAGELKEIPGQDLYEVVSAITFRSPSAAAKFVSASSINGLDHWMVEGEDYSLNEWIWRNTGDNYLFAG